MMHRSRRAAAAPLSPTVRRGWARWAGALGIAVAVAALKRGMAAGIRGRR
jgi:hypothetical protein